MKKIQRMFKSKTIEKILVSSFLPKGKPKCSKPSRINPILPANLDNIPESFRFRDRAKSFLHRPD